MNSPKSILFCVFACLLLGLLGCSGSEQEISFNDDIRPIINDRCVKCHGGIKEYSDLNLIFREDATGLAESGLSAIVPKDASGSELIRRISHGDPEKRMPPEGPALSKKEIEVLTKWIDQGAEWEQHWAYADFQTLTPASSENAWAKSQIDLFNLAKLDALGMSPKEEADCPVLLRRVSLDLKGLPPDYRDVQKVCSDFSDDKYSAFVDQLLASPSYGERWASLWLDLARYADSQGYEKDDARSHWRYRDWVIAAFDNDMPFDQFSIEQLAGDLLPNPSDNQILATAFHRNTMTNTEGGTDDEEFRVAAVIDRVNTTFEVWQGTTMACVQCHGHPYDPFRAEEYYQSYAFFNNTADYDKSDESPVFYEFDEEDKIEGLKQLSEFTTADELIETEFERLDLELKMNEWRSSLLSRIDSAGVPPLFRGKIIPRDLVRIVQKPDSLLDDKDLDRMREHFASISPELEAIVERRRKHYRSVRSTAKSSTGVLSELPIGKRRTTRVLERGNFLVPGIQVEAETPKALLAFDSNFPNNRLGFAKWMLDDENALTARVTVNRFWEQLFGTGLVETLEDFGSQGFLPSHPDLLEWLAKEFVHEHGWSVKKLLRQIVLSATYRQSSTASREEYLDDPKNRLLARGPRLRLTAEMIRDQALAVSGLLSAKKFGPSVMPEQPDGLWKNPYSGLRWIKSEGEDQYRRGLYTFWRRTVPYPSLLSFDGVSREFCVSRRIQTNTPLQALVTLNDPVYVEAAEALANRMKSESRSDSIEELARTGYRLTMMHEPNGPELKTLVEIYHEALGQNTEQAIKAYSSWGPREMKALATVGNVILNLDSVIMK